MIVVRGVPFLDDSVVDADLRTLKVARPWGEVVFER